MNLFSRTFIISSSNRIHLKLGNGAENIAALD